ncbi:MAG: hypothetical protein WDZ66_05850 [Steroidobacteraceae bacterium]
MSHPIYDILMRWLETEQCAFDAEARDDWPWDTQHPAQSDAGTDSAPTPQWEQIDDAYGEPQTSS